MKFLLLLALVGVVYLVWRAKRTEASQAESRPRPPAPAPAPAPALPQDMVRCSHCAVHLPRDEAVADAQGRLYCGAEHRDSVRAP